MSGVRTAAAPAAAAAEEAANHPGCTCSGRWAPPPHSSTPCPQQRRWLPPALTNAGHIAARCVRSSSSSSVPSPPSPAGLQALRRPSQDGRKSTTQKQQGGQSGTGTKEGDRGRAARGQPQQKQQQQRRQVCVAFASPRTIGSQPTKAVCATLEVKERGRATFSRGSAVLVHPISGLIHLPSFWNCTFQTAPPPAGGAGGRGPAKVWLGGEEGRGGGAGGEGRCRRGGAAGSDGGGQRWQRPCCSWCSLLSAPALIAVEHECSVRQEEAHPRRSARCPAAPPSAPGSR